MVTALLVSTAIGDRIVSLRTERDWTQGQLATYARVEQTWLSNVEAGGTKRPAPDLLLRVARALGTTMEYLLTGHSDEPEPAKAAALRRLADWPLDRLLEAEVVLRALGRLAARPIPGDEHTDPERDGHQD